MGNKASLSPLINELGSMRMSQLHTWPPIWPLRGLLAEWVFPERSPSLPSWGLQRAPSTGVSHAVSLNTLHRFWPARLGLGCPGMLVPLGHPKAGLPAPGACVPHLGPCLWADAGLRAQMLDHAPASSLGWAQVDAHRVPADGCHLENYKKSILHVCACVCMYVFS